MKERNLVISWRTYEWVNSCVIPIMREPKKFEVMVVCKDDSTPILADCDIDLCADALYAQRKYDLYNVGTVLGLPKLTNLLFDEDDVDIEKLTAKLQLSIVLNGVNKIYFSYNKILAPIMSVINNKLDIDIYSFGNGTWHSENHIVCVMTDEEKENKLELVEMCIGGYAPVWVGDYEIFHKI